MTSYNAENLNEYLRNQIIELCDLINSYYNKNDLTRLETYKRMLKDTMNTISSVDFKLMDECQEIINKKCSDYIQTTREKYKSPN